MFWRNLPLATKLTTGFGVVLALLAAIVTIAYLGMGDIVADGKLASEYRNAVATIKAREANHLDWALKVSSAILHKDVPSLNVQTDPRLCRFGLWYYSDERRRLETMAPEVTDNLLALESHHNRFHESIERIRELWDERGDDAGRDAVAIFNDVTMPNMQNFMTLMHSVENEINTISREKLSQLDRHAARNLMLVSSIGVAAVILGLVIAWVIASGITRPLREVVRAADSISRGDLAAPLDIRERDDEIGTLARAFRRMARSLQGFAASMKQISEGDFTTEVPIQSEADILGNALHAMNTTLRDLSQQIRQTVDILASSVSQISSSSSEFSSASAETATAVTQTTATVEQVKQTAGLTSEKAQVMTESAQQAIVVTRDGTRSTEEMLEAVRLIDERMDYIAQNIVQLSEKTRDISEIINAVRDLADQSNILAVNASIEASKAGEEGRGFSIVASEIRSLAEQSKQATAQVRTMLGEIQKATAAAVMATEEGAKAVVTGREKSEQARQAITQLSRSITGTSNAATQIAVSSKEELVGMDQMALAMENIKLASSQNVDSARQLEDSVRSLNDLAHDLRQLVSRFKV